MSIKSLIETIKKDGILRASGILEELYKLATENEAQLAALTSQLESVVAENASVKAMNDCLSEELRSYESDGAFDGPKMHMLWWKVQTPATDAFLAEVRASGVELMREHPAIKLCSLTHVCDEFAAQLRQGGAV